MTNRPAPPPPLEIQYPLCPLCGEEVDHDGDCFYCPRCSANWSDVGNDTGIWDDDTAAGQCPSIDGRYLPGGISAWERIDTEIHQCLLTAGHAGDHSHVAGRFGRRYCWTDEHAATEQQRRPIRDVQLPESETG